MQIQSRPKHTNRAYYKAMIAARPNRAARRAAAKAALAIAQAAPSIPALVEAAPVIVLGEDTAPVNQNQRIYTRPYIVREMGEESWHMVRSAAAPVGYKECKGPFKTTRAAQYGVSNPALSVAECEKLSKVTA